MHSCRPPLSFRFPHLSSNFDVVVGFVFKELVVVADKVYNTMKLSVHLKFVHMIMTQIRPIGCSLGLN